MWWLLPLLLLVLVRLTTTAGHQTCEHA